MKAIGFRLQASGSRRISLDEFRRMGRRAWDDSERMQVLADLALEDGLNVERLVDEYRRSVPIRKRGHNAADDQMYAVESFVRKAILRAINPRLELRVSGRYPDIEYVVTKVMPQRSWLSLPFCRTAFMGRPTQHRLLRAPRLWTFTSREGDEVRTSGLTEQEALDEAQRLLNVREFEAGRTPPTSYGLVLTS